MELKNVVNKTTIFFAGQTKFNKNGGLGKMKKEKIEYYKQKLLEWKASLEKEATKTLDLERSNQWVDSGDFGDQASAETDHNIMLRIREREKNLIAKIDKALENPDVVVVANNHPEFGNLAREIDESGCKLIYDVWGIFDATSFKKAAYMRLGRGT